MRRVHHPGQWLVVSTPSATLDLQAGEIGDEGLLDLRSRDRSERPVPASIPWSAIARIERRESRATVGRNLGFALGAVAGGYAGAAIGEASSSRAPNGRSYNDAGAFIGTAAGAIVGARFGKTIGDRSAIYKTVYVGGPADRARVRPVETTERVVADLSPLAPALSTHDVLRVRGSFGEFTGRVSTIDARGSVGLERAAGLDPELPIPAEPLMWDEITRVERRGGSSRTLAISAATVIGVTAGTLAAWVSAAIGNEPRDITGAFVVGSMAGSVAGASVGALIGAFIPGWHRLYNRLDARHGESI